MSVSLICLHGFIGLVEVSLETFLLYELYYYPIWKVNIWITMYKWLFVAIGCVMVKWCLSTTCSSPRGAVRSHSLVCSEKSLLIVGIGPILNKELEFIFRSDHHKIYIYERKEKCFAFCILKCNA